MAGNLGGVLGGGLFLLYFWCVLTIVVYGKNVLIEKYELKLDLISQKAKIERNIALLKRNVLCPACNLN